MQDPQQGTVASGDNVHRRNPPVARGPGYWVALGFFVLVGIAHFSVWMAGVTRPTVVGLPPVFLYHAAYCLVALAAVMSLFRAIWPPTED